MTFLSHPACSSGFILDFLDYYTLEWQKAVSAALCASLYADTVFRLAQSDKSMCVLATLNAISFDKQIYIYLQVQKLSGDF